MADTKLKLTIPEAFAGRPVAAITARYGYKAVLVNPLTGEETNNPVTPLQFTAGILMRFVKENVIAHEVPDLAKEDRAERVAEINAVQISVEQIVEE